MPRYFLEVAYKGTNYSGFQIQHNANTVQSEMEKALQVLLKQKIELTGSSRTDAGVHAYQNYFHFDFDAEISSKHCYNLNAILPFDISVKNIFPVAADAHCRFDAVSREYKYFIYQQKNPFLNETAYYYPYKLNMEMLKEAAAIVKEYRDFTSFSKRKTQAKTAFCHIMHSEWMQENGCIVYYVTANRFLRGMVRGLVGTMLNVAREKLTLNELRTIFESRDCSLADFSVPGAGLFLVGVEYEKKV